MANYNVGIDFGTSLTKICVNKMDNNGGYIFYKFPKTNSYLLKNMESGEEVSVKTEEIVNIVKKG